MKEFKIRTRVSSEILDVLEPGGEKMKDKSCEDIREIFRENKIGLYDICRHWIYTYPEDIFITAPDEIVQIRILMECILSKRKKV